MTVLEGIDSAVSQAIAAMATPAYKLDYGTPNVQDPSAWDAGNAAPFTSWLTSAASPTQTVSKNTEVTPLQIRAALPFTPGLSDLQLATRGIEDIMRMIGANFEALRAAGVLFIPEFKSSGWANRGVVARPVEVTVVYNITWRTDFINPSST